MYSEQIYPLHQHLPTHPALCLLVFNSKPIKISLCYSCTLAFVVFHWSVAYLPGAIPLRRLTLPLLAVYQLPIAPELGVGLGAYLLAQC